MDRVRAKNAVSYQTTVWADVLEIATFAEEAVEQRRQRIHRTEAPIGPAVGAVFG